MTTDKCHIPATAPMWWDGGDRAITAREKATIEEHGPSCYTIPLLPAQAVDPADPWRGLYLPARMPAPSEYGDLTHPDIPRWPDDREDALDKLVHAQGFDFHIVAGDFTEEAMEDGDELYWQELRAWNPEAPEGEWRLAWKGDTEDGPYAWFVRPMALRPEPVALAAIGKQVGEEQGDGLVTDEMVQTFKAALSRAQLPGKTRTYFLKDSELPSLLREVLAARQPVGQDNPLMAYADSYRRMANLGSGRVSCLSVAYDIETNMAKHAAPPAQAVDMGQFNALAALANAIVHHRGESPMKNGVFAEAERLLALIDQSDAAPGVE